MKIALIAAILLTLTGCARVQVLEWKDRDITVCGNVSCDAECYAKKVSAACPGKAEQIEGFHLSSAEMYKRTGRMEDNMGNCKKYACSEKLNFR